MTIPNPPITPELRLKHYLYLAQELNTFITGDPEFHKHFNYIHVSSLSEIIKTDVAKVCSIIDQVHATNAIPYRKTIFFIMACTLKQAPGNRTVYTQALNLIKSNEDLFELIKFLSKNNVGFPSGVQNVINTYYLRLLPMDFIKEAVHCKGYHSWSHKDLIKLSHLKTTDPVMDVVVTYILKGLEAAVESAGNNKDAVPVLEFIKASEAFKKNMDDEDSIKYIQEHKIPYKYCPQRFRKSPKVLEVVLKNTELKDIFAVLVKLYKAGLMKQDTTPVNQTVSKILNNPEAVKESKVHPIEVFLAWKLFEKGGKPKDPKLVKYLEDKEKQRLAAKQETEAKTTNFAQVEPIKCPPIMSAFKNCLLHSFNNVEPTHRRFLITLENSEEMNQPCLNSKHITCFEAALMMILTYKKTEKNVTVATFNGPSIFEVNLDKDISLHKAILKVKESKSGPVQMGAPMEWAKRKKKSIDVFINIARSMNCKEINTKDQPLLNPWDAFVKYKSAMNMSTPKLIFLNLTDIVVFSNIPNNAMDVRGFDRNVPKVIDAFLKNYF